MSEGNRKQEDIRKKENFGKRLFRALFSKKAFTICDELLLAVACTTVCLSRWDYGFLFILLELPIDIAADKIVEYWDANKLN